MQLNVSSPGFGHAQFSLGLCSLCIRTINVSAMVIAGSGTRKSIANVAAGRVMLILQQQRFHESSLYRVLHENTQGIAKTAMDDRLLKHELGFSHRWRHR